MKKVLILALTAVLALGAAAENASAQKFELGVRAGIGSQDMDVEALGLFDNPKAKLGWNVAAVSRIRLIGFGDGLLGAGLFFQPEVVYSQSNIKAEHFVLSYGELARDSEAHFPVKISMKTVDIPLLLSLKVSLVRIQAGPVVNLMNNLNSTDGGLDLLPLRAPVGYALGASVDLGPLVIDGRYHGEFEKLKYKEKGLEEFRGSLSSWSVGVGIMF